MTSGKHPHSGRGTPVMRMPEEVTPYFLLIPIKMDVNPSTTTEFSIGPASQPTSPASATSFNTTSRDARPLPVTRISQLASPSSSQVFI